jgi:hypothetical protein
VSDVSRDRGGLKTSGTNHPETRCKKIEQRHKIREFNVHVKLQKLGHVAGGAVAIAGSITVGFIGIFH